MKSLLKIVVLVGLYATIYNPMQVYAADGMLAYETASSSVVVQRISVSSLTATMVMMSTTTAERTMSGRAISWYSVTAYNLNTSSSVYRFTPWADQTVTLSCSNGAPIAAGSASQPSFVTEQALMQKMWILGCGTTGADFGIVQRGR